MNKRPLASHFLLTLPSFDFGPGSRYCGRCCVGSTGTCCCQCFKVGKKMLNFIHHMILCIYGLSSIQREVNRELLYGNFVKIMFTFCL